MFSVLLSQKQTPESIRANRFDFYFKLLLALRSKLVRCSVAIVVSESRTSNCWNSPVACNQNRKKKDWFLSNRTFFLIQLLYYRFNGLLSFHYQWWIIELVYNEIWRHVDLRKNWLYFCFCVIQPVAWWNDNLMKNWNLISVKNKSDIRIWKIAEKITKFHFTLILSVMYKKNHLNWGISR